MSGFNSEQSLVPYRYYTFLYARYCIDIFNQIRIRVYVDVELNNKFKINIQLEKLILLVKFLKRIQLIYLKNLSLFIRVFS
jgi:hypothetical protein